MTLPCYNFTSAFTLEVLVSKLRVAVISVMSAGLGGVASGGLRLLDSRSSMVALVGGAAVLSVALVLDAVRMAGALRGVVADVAGVRKDVGELHGRLDVIEVKLTGLSPRSSSAGRTGSYPAL